MTVTKIKEIVNKKIAGLEIKRIFEYDPSHYVIITDGNVDNVLMFETNTDGLAIQTNIYQNLW